MAGNEDTPAARKTPAGGKEHYNWALLQDAIAGLYVFLKGIPASAEFWHVIFRCGTVVRLRALSGDEFVGYDHPESSYIFPTTEEENDEVIDRILEDNRRIWETQSKIPGDVGKAIRIGYAPLIARGYPYPGGAAADRSVVDTGIEVKDKPTARRLWFVLWPGLDGGGEEPMMFNLALTEKGGASAAASGGDLRRYDFMFPEVGAVITPDHVLWMYSPAGVFEPALKAEAVAGVDADAEEPAPKS
jgi:hypothetical protein